MRSVPVVMVVPAIERLGSLSGVLIGVAVGPLAQRRLDEALSLAVGLRLVGPREAMTHTERFASGGEVLGSEGRAVVG